ncbi:amidohydrolase [Streptosporangium sp. NPDC049078]|uniref:amidohydrolase n=1 Tax=Streptosporangium sp. NPDC049078 TaxID=3155767 RepID=UPI00343A4F4E
MTIAKRPSHPESSNSVREAILASRTEWEESAIALSREIHRVPEIAFQERHASTLVARELEAAGFDVAIGAYGLDTAVEATYGSGDVTVAICAEYDALPGIGHACGHNIIGAAAVGAAIALTAVADRIGLRIKLLGTPAEEHGGGKVIMLDAGAWDDVTFSLMVHGAPGEDVRCLDVRTQAVCRLHIMFQGRPGHTGGPTPSSDNASNAATIGLVALGLLRQHLPDGVRANAFVSEGGQTTNVVPAAAAVRVEVRADTLEDLQETRRRILTCFEGGATAAGCTWSWDEAEPTYADMRQDPILAAAWDRSLASLGREIRERPRPAAGSTDMGNVSHAVPSIHPLIAVLGSTSWPHTPEFTADATGPAAERAAIDGALAMALTVVDVVTGPHLGQLSHEALRAGLEPTGT